MQVKTPISPEIKEILAEVEKELKSLAASDNKILTKAATQTLNAGGKRLRPALVLLCGGVENKEILMPAAVAIETIHMASLIHDDLIDKTETRRGKPTINHVFSEEVAVKTGDYLFAKAFEKMAEYDDASAVSILAKAAIDLTLGEILQQKTAYNPNQTEAFYLSKIKFKTASLFEASCKIAALLADKSDREINAMAHYGANLGYAFQIFDDVLDVVGDANDLGKPTGTDLIDGIITLPYIYASDNPGVKKPVHSVIKKVDPSRKEIENVLKLVNETDAIERSKERAVDFIRYAVSCLKNIVDKQTTEKLEDIASFVVDRYN